MVRKNIIYFLAFLAISIGIFSCAKKQAPATAFERIQGNWKLTKIGSDDNENGAIETPELHAVPVGQDYERKFNKDGTGIETNSWPNKGTITLPFKWQIEKGDSVTMIYAANDTLTYLLRDVSSQSLTLIAYGNVTLEEYYYTKK